MKKDYLKLGIRDFCEQMLEGKFADSDIYIYADNVSNKEDFLSEVLVASMLSDNDNDYYGKVESYYKKVSPQETRFSDIIQYKDKEKLLERLHQLIGNTYGAHAGAIIQRAKLDEYLMRYPTQEEFKKEFGLKGSWQAVHNYFDEKSLKALDKSNKIVIF